MKLALLTPEDEARLAAARRDTLADEDGDGFDDETGEPVEPEDAEAEEGDEEPAEEEEEGELTAWVLALEDAETGDGRYYASGAFTWAELPLPFMATDVTDEGHDGAMLVAQIVRIERVANEILGWTRNIVSEDPQVLRLQQLIDNGELRGVSVDLDQISGVLEIEPPTEEEAVQLEEGETITIPIGSAAGERFNFDAARIRGATAVPFPAFAEAKQIAASLVASAGTLEVAQPDELPIAAPVSPPREWFVDPQLGRPTALAITPLGQIVGHLALWDSCHIGFQDRCVVPPRSASSYAAFHSGLLVTEDGTQIRVGQITTSAGHADLSLPASGAKEHYDHTGWAAADVRVGEDEFGIWIAGAVRPGLAAAALREFMAADVSGDWRRVDGALELVGIASVNVPGFSKARFADGERAALVASVPICEDPVDDGLDAVRERIAATIGRSSQQLAAERERIAWRVGRHPEQLRQEIAHRIGRFA